MCVCFTFNTDFAIIYSMNKLADISKIRTGYTLRSAIDAYESGQVEVIQAKDLTVGLQSSNRPRIDLPGSAKHTLKSGDVLVSARGAMRAAVYEDASSSAIASSSLFVVRITSSHFTPDYIVTYLNSTAGRKILTKRSSGGSIQTITKDDLAQVPIPPLAIDRQRELSRLMQTVNNYQSLLTEKLKLIENLKASIISDTITEKTS